MPGSAQRGSATLTTVLVLPALLLAITAVFQAVLYEHAAQAARLAAAQALTALEGRAGSAPAALAEARAVLDQLGSPLSAVAVEATRSGGLARVVVSGYAQRLLPGLTLRVSGLAAGPVQVPG